MSEIERLKLVHENTSGQDRELFYKQLLHFRKIMCSTAFTLENKENEFGYLAEAYFRCNLTQSDIDFFVLTKEEFDRRSIYERLHFKTNDALHENQDANCVNPAEVNNE